MEGIKKPQNAGLTMIFLQRVDESRGVVSLVGERLVYGVLERGSTGDSSELPVSFLTPIAGCPGSFPQYEAGKHYGII